MSNLSSAAQYCIPTLQHKKTQENLPTHTYYNPKVPHRNMYTSPWFCSAVWAWWAIVMSPLEMEGQKGGQSQRRPWPSLDMSLPPRLPPSKQITVEPTLSRKIPPPPPKKKRTTNKKPQKNSAPLQTLGKVGGKFQPVTSKQLKTTRPSCLPPCQPAARTGLVPSVRRRCKSCNRPLTLHTM